MNQHMANVVRRARRRRWWLWVILLAAAGGWVARFGYLRITVRPTPRPEFWQAKLDALDPPPPGAISPSEAYHVIRNRPWESGPGVSCVDLLRGPWDEDREDISAATAIFVSDAFRESHRRFALAVNAGWREPPAPLQRWNPITIDYFAWADWLMAHSRWEREHSSDLKACADDWFVALRYVRQLYRCHSFMAYWPGS